MPHCSFSFENVPFFGKKCPDLIRQENTHFFIAARFLRRDSVSSIVYSEELISDTISATLQSTDRHYGIVDQEPDHFRRDS